MRTKTSTIPKSYLLRRVHSIFGLMIVLFLIEHLLTNSQAALLFGENGEGFIRSVNFIKNLPYLPFVEIFLIGVPILVHGVLGIKYALTSKSNSWPTSGEKPSLTAYPRNHAYTWQRITSWILLIGIILHVGYMRFYRYPDYARVGDKNFYFTRVDLDPGLYTVSSRLGVQLYGYDQVEEERLLLHKKLSQVTHVESAPQQADVMDRDLQKSLNNKQGVEERIKWLKALTHKTLTKNQVMTVSSDFGTATLLMVRDAFKSPVKAMLYTIFVLAACFHAFNGLWTFCITWGWVIRVRSQARLANICVGVMIVIAFLGLASIWGTYWLNLAR
jgi:succinate dehydrogenase / fumarate reductase cytochrome b subunit